MGLLKCPDCGKEFSDRIDACPNCACPKSAVLEELELSRKNTVEECPPITPTHICISKTDEKPSNKYGNLHIKGEDIAYHPSIKTQNENPELERIYVLAKSTMESAQTEFAYKGAANTFLSIKGYKDSDILAKQCIEKAEAKRLKREQNVAFHDVAPKKKKDQTFDKYFELNASKSLRGCKTTLGVLAIISAVVSFVLLALGNYFALVDIVLSLVLGVLIVKKNSWIYPLFVAIYQGVACFINIDLGKSTVNLFPLAISIYVMYGIIKLKKEYESGKQSE